MIGCASPGGQGRRDVLRRAAAVGLLLGAMGRGSASPAEDPGPSPPPASAPIVRPPLPEKLHGPRQLRYDAVYLARRPFELGKRGKIKLYATAGAAVALYLGRDEIRDWVLDHRSESRSRLLDDVRTMGKGGVAPSLALIAFGASFATGDPGRERETAVLLLESAGYSAFLAYAGSFTLAAERPEQGDSLTFFDTSGHGVSVDAALAASVVTPLRRQYLRVQPGDGSAMRAWKWSATVLLYGGAVLTGYQRMDDDQHWAPDVFLGLSAGFDIGRMLCDAHDEAGERRARLALNPVPGGGAVRFTWRPRRSGRTSVGP